MKRYGEVKDQNPNNSGEAISRAIVSDAADVHGADLTSEIRLVRDAQAGSKESFCKLYGMYKDNLYRYALYKLGDPSDAEDAVSECVLAAWKGIRALRSEHAFSSWIFRILSNICAGMISKAISAREGLEQAGRSVMSSQESTVVTSVELAEALSRLDEEEREVVLLSVVSGLTSSEISGITGLKPGAVRSKLSRSLNKMKTFLS